MKIATMALAALLVVCSADRKANTEKPANERNPESRSETAPTARPDSEDLILVPFELRFVMQPGHPMVILATGACKPGETGGRIELLPPVPDFIEVIPVCQYGDGRGVVAALVIKPSNKDVGLHQVSLRTNGCDGSGSQRGFEVKVKKP